MPSRLFVSWVYSKTFPKEAYMLMRHVNNNYLHNIFILVVSHQSVKGLRQPNIKVFHVIYVCTYRRKHSDKEVDDFGHRFINFKQMIQKPQTFRKSLGFSQSFHRL